VLVHRQSEWNPSSGLPIALWTFAILFLRFIFKSVNPLWYFIFCFIPLRFLTDGMMGKQPLCNILFLLEISDSILLKFKSTVLNLKFFFPECQDFAILLIWLFTSAYYVEYANATMLSFSSYCQTCVCIHNVDFEKIIEIFT
jgi:hypothetical protein